MWLGYAASLPKSISHSSSHRTAYRRAYFGDEAAHGELARLVAERVADLVRPGSADGRKPRNLGVGQILRKQVDQHIPGIDAILPVAGENLLDGQPRTAAHLRAYNYVQIGDAAINRWFIIVCGVYFTLPP